MGCASAAHWPRPAGPRLAGSTNERPAPLFRRMEQVATPFALLRRAMLGALLLCIAWSAQPAYAQDAGDDAPDPRQTWVIVREGEAGVAVAGGAQQVLPGQTATIAGPTGGVAEVRDGAGLDGLDTWSADRDRVYEGGRQTATYVSRTMVG